MTIQNWSLYRDRASVVCDTLASHAVTKAPSGLMAKAWCVPERSIMLASKDWAHPALQFYAQCLVGLAPTSLWQLVEHAGEVMRSASSQMPECLLELPSTRSILFGWDPDANRIQGWLYQAQSDFQPEPMPLGHMLAPDVMHDQIGERPDWPSVAERQQASDRELPLGDRDNIGGWLMHYEMVVQPDGSPPLITMRNLGKMPYFEADSVSLPRMADPDKRGTNGPAHL